MDDSFPKSKNVTQYKRVRSKLLKGDVNCLTDRSIACFVEWWEKESSNSDRNLCMAVLLSGLSLEKLLNDSLRYEVDENNFNVGKVYADWNFPKIKNRSYTDTQFEAVTTDPFILLPYPISSGVLKSRQLKMNSNAYEKELNYQLSQLKNDKFQRVTVKRLQQHLRSEKNKFDLSSSDIDFLSLKPYKKSSHSHYGFIELNEILKKHNRYISHILRSCAILKVDIPSIENDLKTGSHRVITDDSLTNLLNFLKKKAGVPPTSLENIKLRHNCLTTYTVIILQLCTLHRPKREIFQSLTSFEDEFSSVVIDDKNVQSHRRIPIARCGRRILTMYLSHLRSLKDDIWLVEPIFHATLEKVLSGKTPLFWFMNSNNAGIFTPRIHFQKSFGHYFSVPTNFARHKIKAVLLERGVNPEYLKYLMGHIDDFEANDALFSERRYAKLLEVSDLIESYLNERIL